MHNHRKRSEKLRQTDSQIPAALLDWPYGSSWSGSTLDNDCSGVQWSNSMINSSDKFSMESVASALRKLGDL